MIFAAVKAGSYVIIENNIVVAKVNRINEPTPNSQWFRPVYRVIWYNGRAEERHTTLASIEKAHRFSNADGYYNLLKERF